MQINRRSILDKTHYGLKIYTYILQQFYPKKTVLTLSGRECRLTKNPFNGNKETLSINIFDNLANHSDTELKDFKGDVFDFSKLYFKISNEEDLLLKINDVLQLNLLMEEPKIDEVQKWLEEPDDTWYPFVSFYKSPIRNVFPKKTMKLYEIHNLIIGNEYKKITNKLRRINDAKEKRILKANSFDYVTFSGTFNKRSDKELEKHSSLITIDFDHLPNIKKVREQLLQDEYFDTEMLFTSPSGDGLKWIIRIDLSVTTHQEYFKAVSNYIKQKYNIEVDQSGKDISRACFLCHDPNAFLHKRHREIL